MKTNSRARNYEKLLVADFSQRDRREVMLDPVVDGFGQKAVIRGMKRAGKAGIVDLGPGRFEGFPVDRHIEILSREPGLTEIAGTVRATGGPSILRGLAVRPQSGGPALSVISGIVFCEDCEFFGTVEVHGSGRLFLKNCLISSSDNGLFLYEKAFAEVIATRISGQPAGILLSNQSSCSLYHCRVESSHGTTADETGAGVFASSAQFYAEGSEFFDNQVGTYLKACADASFIACHWRRNSIAALITESTPPAGKLAIQGSLLQGPEDGTYPLVSLEGGSVGFSSVRVESPGLTALSATGSSLEVDSSEFRSLDAPAVDLEAGVLSARDSRFLCTLAPGLKVSKTSGSISGGIVAGNPPMLATQPLAITLNGVSNQAPPQVLSPLESPRVVTLETIPSFLNDIIGQSAVKAEVERLLRLAFAARERKRHGIPQDPPVFSGLLTGPALSGQKRTLEIFASVLHEMGELESPDVLEIALSELPVLDPAIVRAGVVMVSLDEPSYASLMSPSTADSILRFVRALNGRCHVFLVGEREPLHALLRTRLDLSRELPTELRFDFFSPSDLSTLFAEHCRRQKIPLGLEAAKKLPVIFHGLHDRLQRRFLNVEGVAELFSETRRNYLERCARQGSFDLELEPGDIVVPLDRSILISLARSAELVAVCPTCKAHNAWLPGLAPSLHCSHCGDEFKATWGLLKNSTFFRKRSVPGGFYRSGAVAMRRTVATAGKP
jgi:hypothetical protein